MNDKILIGCDGSARSEDALTLGGSLARSLDAVPVVASIVPYSRYLLSEDSADEVVERISAPSLAMAKEHLGELEIETRATLNESAAAGLHGLAEEEEALLVVVGSSHRGSVGRMLIGSVGTSLLTGASCPVAVAPRGYAGRDGGPISSIAVGFDGSGEARGALEVAVALAHETGSRILIIGALEPINPYFYPVAPLDDDSYLSAAEEALERSLAEAVELARWVGLEVEARLVRGQAARSIAEASADQDLLVLGSRGFGPLKRTFLGSVSSRIMQSAACPVLVVPRGAGAPRLGLAPPRSREKSG